MKSCLFPKEERLPGDWFSSSAFLMPLIAKDKNNECSAGCVSFEPRAHWHGASVTAKIVHIAITNYKEEEQVSWLQPVTDEEYKQVKNDNIFKEQFYEYTNCKSLRIILS